jgi:hypothetical protein
LCRMPSADGASDCDQSLMVAKKSVDTLRRC